MLRKKDGVGAVSVRLMEMGRRRGGGSRICSALGDPIAVELRGYRLSLRKSEASRMAVELPI